MTTTFVEVSAYGKQWKWPPATKILLLLTMTFLFEATTMNQNPRGVPGPGDVILIKAATLRCFFRVPVTRVEGDHIVTGSGMGTRVVEVSAYGKQWKWPPAE